MGSCVVVVVCFAQVLSLRERPAPGWSAWSNISQGHWKTETTRSLPAAYQSQVIYQVAPIADRWGWQMLSSALDRLQLSSACLRILHQEALEEQFHLITLSEKRVISKSHVWSRLLGGQR